MKSVPRALVLGSCSRPIESLGLALLMLLLAACGSSSDGGSSGAAGDLGTSDGGAPNGAGTSGSGAGRAGSSRGGDTATAGSADPGGDAGASNGGEPNDSAGSAGTMNGGSAGAPSGGNAGEPSGGNAGAPSGGNAGMPSGGGAGSAGVSGSAGGSDMPVSVTIGGTLIGLSSAHSVVLKNNGGDALTLTQNGSFTFASAMTSGGSYAVSVATQPAGQTCSVSNGNGSVLSANVTSVVVTCSSNTYAVGGTLSGLPAGKSVSLQNNGDGPLLLTANGSFSFPSPVADGAGYTVVVSTQPAGVTCSVNAGTGTVSGANVSTVSVNCSANAYTVGGTVTGLAAGKALILRNNGGDDLTLSANGSYKFKTPVTSGSSYTVTLQTAPKGQTCNVINAGGTMGNANVTTVNVFCSNVPYTVGGTISGLSGGQLTLNLTNGQNYAFTQNGPFTIPGGLSDGQSYAVTVVGQPVGQFCALSNGTGTINAANVTNVTFSCAKAFVLSAGIQTLAAGQKLVLQNNGGDNLTVDGPVSNGSATFANALYDGTAYNVSILTQPAGQTCKVTNGTGTIMGANNNTPVVTCSQLTVSLAAPSLANGHVTAYLFSGGALLAGRQNITLDASGNASFLLSTASTTISSVTANNNFFPAALLDGSYSVLVSVDKSGNGLLAANADDWNYFGAITIAGPTKLNLTSANLKPYLNFGLTFNGQTALANMNYFCAAHLPGGDIFADFAQRTLFGVATGTVNAAGTGSLVSGVVAQGTFDFTCLADNPNASSGAVELQPYSLSTGKGVDSGFDYIANQSQVAVQAAGTAAVSGFSLASFSSATPACSGTFVSGGTGTPGTGSFNGNNNSSLLAGGAPSGCVAGTAAGVHKTASVQTVSGSGAGHYSFGNAYLTNRVGNSFTMIIPLTNTSGSAKGGVGVAFNGVTFFDTTQALVGTSVAAKIAGSACVSGSSTMSTCLAAGETGYLLVTGSTGYATVSSVSFTISDNAAATGMNAKAIPQTFTRFADGELRIRLTNSGLGNADLSTLSTSNFSFVVTFDENGNPTDWTTLSDGFADHVFAGNHIAGTSAPKNSLVLFKSSIAAPLDITSPKIKVFLSFGDTTTPAN